MTLAPGDRFGSYEVIRLIGVGGMGEVYCAHDARLRRDVALKVLPDARHLDPEALQRFEREARLLASLNHPNIATLLGLEASGNAQALVMELVDGETLDDRLARSVRAKGMPLIEVLQIARQIAEALDAAHERGVVHRDLKPANIKLRTDGTVKVLDFGIAKVFDADPGAHRGATVEVTRMPGAMIGTPRYMSPEQANGGAVDRRTDIWAFGCVLYEMLTRQCAFGGDTDAAILARVIEREPDWSKLPHDLPARVRSLLQHCLAKDPRKRLRDSGDARFDLEQALEELRAPTSAAAATGGRTTPQIWMAIAAVSALTAIGLAAVLAYPRRPAAAPEPVRFTVAAPDHGRFETPLQSGSGAPVGGSISPDGRTLAFTARGATGAVLLWVRPLDSLEARALPGTEEAALPFWSPDSKSLGFFADVTLKRVDIGGGPPQTLTGVARGQGGTWGPNGTIVFAGNLRSGLLRVSASGGEPVAVTTLASAQRAHRFPYFLPDGRRYLYYVESERPEGSGVFVGDLESSEGRRLLAADSAAVHAPPDRLLFVRRGTLFMQRFDLERLAAIGEPVSLAQSVPFEGSAPAFSVSKTAALTYRTGPADSDEQQFAWLDRTGKVLEVVATPGTYRGVDLSPDGTRIAVHDHQNGGGDIWVIEARGTKTRVTFDPSQDNSSPIWSPDGRRIAFGSLRNGRWGLYHASADGEGDEVLLYESEIPKIPASWSPDGRYLVHWLYDRDNGVRQWVLPLSDPQTPPARLSTLRFLESHAQISPDGQWVAYMSVATGRAEVYVRPFPSGEGVWQVSANGGVTPRWRGDGKELFFATSYDHGQLMAVSIDASRGRLMAGVPRALLRLDMSIVPHSTAVQNFHTYAASHDGQRFLVPLPVATLRGETTSPPIAVVLNWTTPLED